MKGGARTRGRGGSGQAGGCRPQRERPREVPAAWRGAGNFPPPVGFGGWWGCVRAGPALQMTGKTAGTAPAERQPSPVAERPGLPAAWQVGRFHSSQAFGCEVVTLKWVKKHSQKPRRY